MTEDLDACLELVQRSIVKHPMAAQAIYSALVREGRAYAATPEGAALRTRLASSESTTRVRTALDILTFGMLDHDAPPGVIPTVLLDAFIQAVFRARFEARLRTHADPA